VPKDTEGGYYAILSCQGIPGVGAEAEPGGEGVSGTIKLRHRGLVPILVTIPGPKVQAVLDVAKPIVTAGAGGRGFKFEVPVRNRGNIHTRVAGSVEFRSESGELVTRFDIESGRGFVLPMHERLFEGQVPVNLPDGIYIATMRMGPQGQAPMRNVFPFYLSSGKAVIEEANDELKAKLLKASAGFMISAAQIDAVVEPGGTQTKAVELTNLTREPINLNLSVVEWLRIVLRPLIRQRIPLTVMMPKDARGERYAAVLFDREDVKLDASPAGQARRSVALRLCAKGTGAPEAEIVEVKSEREPSGTLRVVARVRNTGDVSIEPEARVNISNAGGLVAALAPASAAPVQAGAEAEIAVRWDRVLAPGEYTAVVSVQYAEKKPAISRGARFVVPKPGEVDTRPATGPLSQPSTNPAPATPPGGNSKN
jgi:hypothetical protein